MLRPTYLIKIQQVPTELWPDRNKLIEIDFVNEYEIHSGWKNHTDTAKITLPKNIILKTDEFLFQQSGTYNVILGGSGAIQNGKNTDSQGNPITVSPLIMRGDVVYIQDGYLFKNAQGADVQVGTTRFSGYVSKVHSQIPIEIECEDNFYLLKRTPVNKTVFSGNLIDLCKYMVGQVNGLFGANTALSVGSANPYPLLSVAEKPDSITANFSLGHLIIGDLTCSQLLSKLRDDYKIESFFVDNELHFGFPIYDEETANSSYFFEFYNNILDDCELEYKNKDDIQLSTVVYCKTISKTGKQTKDGKDKTKKSKLRILVYWDIPTASFKYIVKKPGEALPDNEGGERHECVYPVDLSHTAPSIETLVTFGIEQLKKYMYTGFKGSFVTFGYPFVRWNDNVNIVDRIMADRNGQYKVKKVIYKGGVNGITQEIFLDYKQQVELPKSFITLSMI